ncbi:hypothetical protein AB0L82_28710 [Nocardia sp. NPDC052001]|uniref:hypothetical protein n=1 Tax=Nocardia sp. NPDC052001 TaxID=3154853 RepID=UPI00342B983D
MTIPIFSGGYPASTGTANPVLPITDVFEARSAFFQQTDRPLFFRVHTGVTRRDFGDTAP